MSVDLLPDFVRNHYEVHEWKHACAVLHEDFPREWSDIVSVLREFRLFKSWIARPGGRKSRIAAYIEPRIVIRRVHNAHEQVVAAH